ncbi:biotin/lipoyl-binding protein, partial [Burkholderia gladioli]|nr:biotin/lipoyl-binding protein [Burkholderia gladioli]
MSFALHTRYQALAAGFAIALGVAACAGSRALLDSHTETTNDAYVAADFTLVAPRVAGQLVEVLVDDNQQVHAGQLLLRIDDRDFRAALMSAQADVEAARAEVANDEAEIARQPALVEQARATLRADDAALQFAQANDARYRDLADNGAGTAQEQQRAASALAGQLARRAGAGGRARARSRIRRQAPGIWCEGRMTCLSSLSARKEVAGPRAARCGSAAAEPAAARPGRRRRPAGT